MVIKGFNVTVGYTDEISHPIMIIIWLIYLKINIIIINGDPIPSLENWRHVKPNSMLLTQVVVMFQI